MNQIFHNVQVWKNPVASIFEIVEQSEQSADNVGTYTIHESAVLRIPEDVGKLYQHHCKDVNCRLKTSQANGNRITTSRSFNLPFFFKGKKPSFTAHIKCNYKFYRKPFLISIIQLQRL